MEQSEAFSAEVERLVGNRLSATHDGEARPVVMPRINGKRFFCTHRGCGAGVFTKIGNIYTCNACREQYEGEPIEGEA